MTEEKLQHLKDEVLAHWRGNVEAAQNGRPEDMNLLVSSCAFCREFDKPEEERECEECPVFKKTGARNCANTPYGTVWHLCAAAQTAISLLEERTGKKACESDRREICSRLVLKTEDMYRFLSDLPVEVEKEDENPVFQKFVFHHDGPGRDDSCVLLTLKLVEGSKKPFTREDVAGVLNSLAEVVRVWLRDDEDGGVFAVEHPDKITIGDLAEIPREELRRVMPLSGVDDWWIESFDAAVNPDARSLVSTFIDARELAEIRRERGVSP